jgi:hypothetical protein
MRKLGSIQRIISLTPIEGADKIEKATVLGWELVVKKGEFQPGQLCVYCEVDSIMPDQPQYEFLRDRKFRIKTIKLKGQVSQGICFPLSILPPKHKGWNEGDDVTELLGIKKHDPQAEIESKDSARINDIHKRRIDKFLLRNKWYRNFMFTPTKSPWPSFIKKTDEDRIQLFPGICEREKDTEFQITEKIDGQSATYFVLRNPRKWQFWKKWIFGVCSRNFQLIKPDNSSYWDVAKKYDIKQIMLNEVRDTPHKLFVLQGEIIGPKIQSNKYGVKENEFYAFTIVVDGVQSSSLGVTYWCNSVELDSVPFLEQSFKLKPSIPEMVEYAKGESELAPVLREGIVVRNKDKNISFKIINPDFLLKYSE